MQIACGKRTQNCVHKKADVRKKTGNVLGIEAELQTSERRYAGKHVTFVQQHQQRWLTTSLSPSLCSDCCWNCEYRALSIWSAINTRGFPEQLHHLLPCSFIQTFCIFHVSHLVHIWRKRLSTCSFALVSCRHQSKTGRDEIHSILNWLCLTLLQSPTGQNYSKRQSRRRFSEARDKKIS